MPNTLAHIGVQGLVTRAAVPGVDLKWVCLGAIVPDVPWIARRIAEVVAPGLPPYEVMLYATVQSALFMCLVLVPGWLRSAPGRERSLPPSRWER
ncbi:MAG: hypothetical protein D6826_10825 [Alphaproteobacteria bacterium]|nr:MAG: hypothetical protein D6826_10825 [Alphaproteobacteria bacterium]